MPASVTIGLDASGSTGERVGDDDMTILDIEKAFSIILGHALNLITPDVNV